MNYKLFKITKPLFPHFREKWGYLALVFALILTFCNRPPEKTAQAVGASTQPIATNAGTEVNYKCPICNYTSTTVGDCPKDKITLVKIGYYYCPECYMSDSVSGKCKMCGAEMRKMKK